ncbi:MULTISPECIES: hypothetical protein [unclassified Pseudoalteromonas]|uniref:hypothetical protein n=1 Tax=unclassified Pseudoalteromonas TaxID=194690 RepID=UPI00110A17BA|nr:MULTISPECIES: hypothetical protein [unclassified Pseudoalteromonas]TMP46646.1 hypothetical protein CWB80_09510 [Pseudoalteromonas sp. S1650]TMP68323.1 hypothetical protein CWB79_05795 [Pseudoalteromonas sp. S1649]
MNVFKKMLLAFAYPLYFFIVGTKQKIIDYENERLACAGANKIAIDFKLSNQNHLTGTYDRTWLYIKGNPRAASKRFISFVDFINKY